MGDEEKDDAEVNPDAVDGVLDEESTWEDEDEAEEARGESEEESY